MNRLAKNSIAAGLTTLLVTTGLSFSAFGADPIVAQSNSSAVTATGITEIVDTGICEVSSTGTPTVGSGAMCGSDLTTQGVSLFSQNASTDLDGQNGTSTASSSAAPIDIPALTTIDLSTVTDDLEAFDSETILEPVLGTLTDGILGDILLDQVLQPILTAIQTSVLDPILAQVQDALPVSAEIGEVASTCTAVPGSATATSSVAGVDILLTVGDQDITVLSIPVSVDTTPNAQLVGEVAPQQIVDDLLDGVEASLNASLDGLAAPLAAIVDTIQTQVVSTVLDAIGPALLEPVGDALGDAGILTATVNKQTPTPVEDSVEVTALSLDVLDGTATLDLGRASCGPNGVVVVNNDDTNADNQADAVADADANADAVADADANGTPAPPAASIADADSAADADVAASLPNAGAPNLLPFFLLGIALLAFGLAVLLNERRRLGLPSSNDIV